MHNNSKRNTHTVSTLRLRVLQAVLAMSVGFALSFWLYWTYGKGIIGYAERFMFQGKPLMTSHDAYYYLEMLRALVEGGYVQTVAGPASLAAGIVSLTGADFTWTAFVLPAVLAASMAACYAALGAAAGRPVMGVVAAAAGASGLYWFIKTVPGAFDTDALNPVLLLLAALGVWWFTEHHGRRRWAGAVLALAACAGLWAWWPQIGFMGFAFCAATYSLSAVFPGGARMERAVKAALLVLGLVALLIIVTGVGAGLPGAPGKLAVSLREHLDFILHKQTSIFPVVTVGELSRLQFSIVANYTAGSVPACIAGLCGAALFAVRMPRLALHLAPLAALGALAFTSSRFIIFLTPIYALGLGFLVSEAARWGPKRKRTLLTPGVRLAVVSVAAAACIIPALVQSLQAFPAPPLKRAQAAMAARLNDQAPAHAVVWSWWSQGHALRYFSRRPVVVDGATLDPRRIFIAAAPLASGDADFAANWMRFFARGPVDKFQVVQNWAGGEAQAIAFLRDLFARTSAADATAEAVCRAHGVEPRPDRLDFLFPVEEAVYVYLDPRILNEAMDWFSLGNRDFDAGVSPTPYFRTVLADEVVVNPNAGELANPDKGVILLSRLALLDANGARVFPYDRGEETPTLLLPKGSDTLFLVKSPLWDSIYMRLMVREPRSTPRFTPLAYQPLQGGWWRVE